MIASELDLDDAFGPGITHGIADDVFNGAMEQLVRASDFTILSALDLDLAVLGAGFKAGIFGDLIEQPAQGHSCVLRRIDQRLYAGKRKQPADHLIEPLRFLLDAIKR